MAWTQNQRWLHVQNGNETRTLLDSSVQNKYVQEAVAFSVIIIIKEMFTLNLQ